MNLDMLNNVITGACKISLRYNDCDKKIYDIVEEPI